jgi:hypothetical protein
VGYRFRTKGQWGVLSVMVGYHLIKKELRLFFWDLGAFESSKKLTKSLQRIMFIIKLDKCSSLFLSFLMALFKSKPWMGVINAVFIGLKITSIETLQLYQSMADEIFSG